MGIPSLIHGKIFGGEDVHEYSEGYDSGSAQA